MIFVLIYWRVFLIICFKNYVSCSSSQIFKRSIVICSKGFLLHIYVCFTFKFHKDRVYISLTDKDYFRLYTTKVRIIEKSFHKFKYVNYPPNSFFELYYIPSQIITNLLYTA